MPKMLSVGLTISLLAMRNASSLSNGLRYLSPSFSFSYDLYESSGGNNRKKKYYLPKNLQKFLPIICIFTEVS